MKNKTPVRNNVLINNFLRATKSTDIAGQYFFYDERLGVSWHKPNELQYHKSWDWLMKAIEACLIENDAYELELHEAHTHAIHNSLWACNIDATYNNVINFIKWYNEETKA